MLKTKKFKKKIVTPAVHTVGRLDGSEEKEAITKERIQGWANETNKMIGLGVLIPAPFTHQDKNGRFIFPVVKGKDGETFADAYSGTNQNPPAWDLANNNGGFWDNFNVDADGSLVAEVEAPGDENDPNTPAGKLGTTVKQTSILVMPPRTLVDKDGTEHQIGEHLAHVANVIHAQEPGQENFIPMASVPPNLAMSFTLRMDSVAPPPQMNTAEGSMGLPGGPQIQDQELYEVISLLRSALNVALPEDSTRENFLSSLKLVLTQKLADQKEQTQQESVTQRPMDGQTKSPGIAMSQTPVAADKAVILLMSQFNKDKRKTLTDRVNKLVATGRISKSYAEKTLFPKIASFAMTAAQMTETGDFPASGLEDLIAGLEEATPIVGESLVDQGKNAGDYPDGAETMDIPSDVVTGLGVEDLAPAVVDSVLDNCSF